MTAKAEKNFLSRERASANAYFDAAFIAVVRKKQSDLATLVQAPPDAKIGLKFAAVGAGLAELLRAEGIRALFEGQAEGFKSLREAQAFEYWEALVFEAAFLRDTTPDRFRRGFSITSFGSSLLALHLGSDETAQAVMQRVVAESHDSPANYFQASTGAITFQARLFELVTEKPLDLDWTKLPSLDGYEALLDPACVGDRYLAALEWGCSEHIAQARESKQKVFPFSFPVFGALPIELVMWLVWRRKLGLERETHGHPLLESPLASLDPAPSIGPPSELMALLEQGIPHMQAYLAR